MTKASNKTPGRPESEIAQVETSPPVIQEEVPVLKVRKRDTINGKEVPKSLITSFKKALTASMAG